MCWTWEKEREVPIAQSKLWPEGNESKNKKRILGESVAAGGKTMTREWEGLVDRRSGCKRSKEREREREQEGERIRRDDQTKRKRERDQLKRPRARTRSGGWERVVDGGRGAVEHVRLGRATTAEGIGARRYRPRRPARRGAGLRGGTRLPRRERGPQPGAAACHCWRQLIVEASRH